MKGPKLLLVDNHDSFTYNIYDYLSRLGAEVSVKMIERVLPEDFDSADGLVLSPGPGNPSKLPDLLQLIQKVVSRKPVLGICLGHQALAYYFGAGIVKAAPMHGKISKVYRQHEVPLLSGIPSEFRVVRYHSLLAEHLPDCLLPILETADGENMAFQHIHLPVMGIQFHPEAHLTEFGLVMLKNWLDVCVKNQTANFSPEI
jgi:anthranilate synthase component 2